MLGKAVQRCGNKASKSECQNTKWKACDGFKKLVQRLRKCIEVRGDFVELLLRNFENSFVDIFRFFYFIKKYYSLSFCI
jgi:hypothetical protein